MHIIGAGIGGSGGIAPTHTLPSSSYKYIKHFYIVRFVNSCQQLSPISVEIAFARLWYHSTYLFSNRVH